MTTVTIEAAPWVLQTAASILKTYSDRAPSSDRALVERIAEQFEAASQDALNSLD
jgi:hypothetical protein